MELGVATLPTEDTIGPVELGRAVEERGSESLSFPEHTHVPASRLTPYPGAASPPAGCSRTYDPFVALGAVAAATSSCSSGRESA